MNHPFLGFPLGYAFADRQLLNDILTGAKAGGSDSSTLVTLGPKLNKLGFNELPLANLLKEAATGAKYDRFERLALVSLVAASQMLQSRDLTQVRD